jgi:hypothetical protein
MPELSPARAARAASPFITGTLTVGDAPAAVRCLPIRSIAVVLEPELASAEGADDVSRAWMALVAEPGLESVVGTDDDDLEAVAGSLMALPPRVRRRQRALATRALVHGAGG